MSEYLLFIAGFGAFDAAIIQREIVVEEENEQMPQSAGLQQLELQDRVLRQGSHALGGRLTQRRQVTYAQQATDLRRQHLLLGQSVATGRETSGHRQTLGR